MKRIFTTSMIETARLCLVKYLLRYRDGLSPAQKMKAPSFGTLWHLLKGNLFINGDGHDFAATANAWLEVQVEEAQRYADQVQQQFGFPDDSIVSDVETKGGDLVREALDVLDYYIETVYGPTFKGRFKVLWCERTFNVPFPTRADRAHPYWRFAGRWDLVLLDTWTGRVIIDDHKSTVRDPGSAILLYALDPQAAGYFYAGAYLATVARPDGGTDDDIAPDAPYWPKDVSAPSGYMLEVTRRKVPKEPPLLKSGKRLSKSKDIDTTRDLYHRAIVRHGLDEADYEDILDRLDRKGPTYNVRDEAAIGTTEIVRWVQEARATLATIRQVELHPETAHRSAAIVCQNQYNRRCPYWEICYGDPDLAMTNFVKRPLHSELLGEQEMTPDGDK